MIHVIAIIELAPGTRNDFLAEFHKIVGPVRAEQGCLEYGPAVDAQTGIPQQQALGSDVVTVVEKWENVMALRAHLAAPHMLAYRERVNNYVKGVRLHILEPA
jgi:quinol monooxygenase YgiN